MKKTPIERIHEKIKLNPETGCWIWTGGLTRDGYAQIWANGKKRYVHRLMYTHYVADIPDRYTIDHLCRVRNCQNPFHLDAVTQRENVLRGETIPARNAFATHCIRGHEFDEENTYIRSDGAGRECRACKRMHSQRHYQENREELLRRMRIKYYEKKLAA